MAISFMRTRLAAANAPGTLGSRMAGRAGARAPTSFRAPRPIHVSARRARPLGKVHRSHVVGALGFRPAPAFVTTIRVRSDLLKNISRLVVKLGTGVLTDARKQPDLAQLDQLVAQVAAQRAAGREMFASHIPERNRVPETWRLNSTCDPANFLSVVKQFGPAFWKHVTLNVQATQFAIDVATRGCPFDDFLTQVTTFFETDCLF